CRERIERDGHKMVHVYSDRAISGANRVPGILSLMADAAKSKFDLVYAEALDRMSRDQEDVAGLYKRLRFADVRIITLAECRLRSFSPLPSAQAPVRRRAAHRGDHPRSRRAACPIVFGCKPSC